MDEKDRSRERSRRDRPSRFSETSRDRSTDRGGRGGDRGSSSKSSSNRVLVSNIPYEYRWQDMKDLFRDQVGDVQFVELFVDENDKPKGVGIVEFADASLVKKCLEVMQRYEVKGRKLVVREDSGNTRDKHGNIVGSGSSKRSSREDRYRDEHRGGGGGGDRYDNIGHSRGGSDEKWGNTYGLSTQFLESLNIDPPLCNRVFVANLEYNIEKKKLKEVFRLAGRVIKVDIPVDKDGRSRGFAVVEYDHPVEAVQAISMLHNQVLFDRPMTVRMDRANDTFKLPEGLKSIGMGLGANGEPLKNVAHNLPSLVNNANPPPTAAAAAGILGAVPNSALQVANALSGLNSGLTGVGGSFGNLSNSSMLQAANLGGLASSLLGNGLAGADLSLASSLVTNPLVQNPSQLAAITANANSNVPPSLANNSGNTGGGNANLSSFGNRNDNFSSNSSNNYGQAGNYSSSRNYQSSGGGGGGSGYDNSQKSSGGVGGGFLSGGGGYDSNNTYGSVSGSMLRSPNQNDVKNVGGNYGRKLLVSNLPPSATYKVMLDKLSEYGDVKFMEEKGQGSVLVIYGSDWQAESAYKNLDRARVDGRVIDARLYP